MALVTGDERIVAAHERAVGTAIGWIEEHAELRRRMDGNIRHETTGQLLYARFTEHASRELDPHLHTHRSEEHTSELQSLMRISYAVFCLKKKKKQVQTKQQYL